MVAEVLCLVSEREVSEMNLTIAYITSRKEPKIEWFLESLCLQRTADSMQLIIVDSLHNERGHLAFKSADHIIAHSSVPEQSLRHVSPKPTIFQGAHRITKEDWWAKSNAMNTAICLCQTEFIAFVDDRCVLAPEWLQCVREAQQGNYAVCGSYEKRANMKVENGKITDYGELLGYDTRHQYGEPVPTRDWYGGSCALPLEWCLAVNGFSEDLCDSLGSEDSMFGVTLRNSGYPMKFDSRMRIIEDRTPSEIDGALKRADKNPHLGRKAKSWDIVRAFHGKTSSQNSFDIRDMRARKLNGEDWRPPSASHFDWYDGASIADME